MRAEADLEKERLEN